MYGISSDSRRYIGAAEKIGESGTVTHTGAHGIHDLRRLENIHAQGSQRVVEQHDHRLTFGHSLAGGLRLFHHLFLIIGKRAVVFASTGQFPFFQADVLVLQGVRQLVRQHRLLLVRRNPVEQVHRLGFGVVKSGHLFAQQAHELAMQIVVGRQQSELDQNRLRPLEPLGVLVLAHALLDVAGDRLARDELALHRMLDGQSGIVTGEAQDLVDRTKEFLLLLLGDRTCWSL